MNILKKLEKAYGANCGRYGSNKAAAYDKAVRQVAEREGLTRRQVQLLAADASRRRLLK